VKDKLRKLEETPKGNKIRTAVGFMLIGLLLITSVTLLYLRSAENGRLSTENQGYIRYMACVVDIRNELETVTVSNEISEACWAQAEKETGIKLNRYTEKVILDKQ